MKRFVLCVTLVLAILSFSMTALAAGETFSGAVEAANETGLFAPIGGTVKTVNVRLGQRVEIGDTLYTLETVNVYAEQAGVIHHVFGQEGDSITGLNDQYGGVLFMEPEADYTIAASTARSYDDDANRIIRVGEMVYLTCYSDGAHTGEGIITQVNGSAYTVKVLKGEFELNETVVVCRDEAYTAASRLGRGTLTKTEPFSVTGSGSIVKMHVKDGDAVKKGDLLFETLTGEFDGRVSSGSEIKSTVNGVVSQVKVNVGGTAQKGDASVTVYEDKNLWIAVAVPEADLALIKQGDTVQVEYEWQDGLTAKGTVNWISALGTVNAATGATTFTAYVSIEPDSSTRIGLNVTVEPVQP